MARSTWSENTVYELPATSHEQSSMEQSRLQKKYETEIKPQLLKEFGYKNVMAAPKLEKVVVNVGLGEALAKPEVIEKVKSYIALIAGQKPVTRLARRSIATFKLRQGQPIGVSVTLRGVRMYDFIDKLFSIVLPRVRDFRGLSTTAFDQRGNYTLGLTEQTVFPEVDYSVIDKTRGFEITIVNKSHSKEESKRLLELLGLPFKKEAH